MTNSLSRSKLTGGGGSHAADSRAWADRVHPRPFLLQKLDLLRLPPIIKPGYPSPPLSEAPKRVLILMSNTGGGHRAAAEAIQESLIYLYGEAVTVAIVDAWKNHIAWPINRLADTYGWIVNRAVWLWRFFWLLEHKPEVVDTFLKIIYPVTAPGLRKLIQTHKPDVIVSTHPLITFFPLTVLKQAKLNIPFITVVTDMVRGYHTWYHPHTTLCLVATEAACQQALGLGIPAERIEVIGQPVALKFAHSIEGKNALRHKLGFEQTRPVILLAGGGEGYGTIFKIARCVARQVSQAQLIIVAGKNKSMQKKLEAVCWEIPTTIFGFVDNLPELMKAADVFITKAGPGSISEAFVAKLPLILFDYIPGQEEGNVRYVLEHKAGVYVPDPNQIPTLLLDWLQPDNPTLRQMAQNAAGLARPEATLTIARRVYELAMNNEAMKNEKFLRTQPQRFTPVL